VSAVLQHRPRTDGGNHNTANRRDDQRRQAVHARQVGLRNVPQLRSAIPDHSQRECSRVVRIPKTSGREILPVWRGTGKIHGMADLTTLKSRRDALEAAIASGVLSISVDGQSTTFASPSQLRSVLRSINDEIAACTGQDRKRPRAAQVYLGGFQ